MSQTPSQEIASVLLTFSQACLLHSERYRRDIRLLVCRWFKREVGEKELLTLQSLKLQQSRHDVSQSVGRDLQDVPTSGLVLLKHRVRDLYEI